MYGFAPCLAVDESGTLCILDEGIRGEVKSFGPDATFNKWSLIILQWAGG